MTIRVLIADDQDIIRAGLTTILNSQPGIDVVAQAADGNEVGEGEPRQDHSGTLTRGIEEAPLPSGRTARIWSTPIRPSRNAIAPPTR